MKTRGTHRLYITTSESYVQSDSGQWSWSWLKICGLPRTHRLFDVMNNEQAGDALEDHDDADKAESCWEYHSDLDHFPSFEGPAGLFSDGSCNRQHERRGARLSTERPFTFDHSPERTTISLPLTARRRRDHSSPVSVSMGRINMASLSKRRFASPTETRGWCQKRHRTSKSLETERRLACLTPRRSREPRSASRNHENDVQSLRHSGANTAQFAYATPHSNNIIASDTGGGDTEPDSNVSSDGEYQSLSDSDDEWQGVVDDEQNDVGRIEGDFFREVECLEDADVNMRDVDAVSSSEDSVVFLGEEETDGKDSDDGITIYEAGL